MSKKVPEGYRVDAKGRLVPEESIRPIDLERDEVIMNIVGEAQALSQQIHMFKAKAFGEVSGFVERSAAQYKVKLGGTKGNVTLVTFDGRYKVERHQQDSMVFDERLQAAKALIDECLHEWTEGTRSEIKTLINDAFDVDSEGRINTTRVLGLQRLNIKDKKWQRAMKAVSESLRVQSSKTYIRVYERIGDTDRYQQIPLNIAAI